MLFLCAFSCYVWYSKINLPIHNPINQSSNILCVRNVSIINDEKVCVLFGVSRLKLEGQDWKQMHMLISRKKSFFNCGEGKLCLLERSKIHFAQSKIQLDVHMILTEKEYRSRVQRKRWRVTQPSRQPKRQGHIEALYKPFTYQTGTIKVTICIQ